MNNDIRSKDAKNLYTKNLPRVLSSDISNSFDVGLMQVSNFFGYINQVGALIRFAAERHRRKVRGICFQNDMLEADLRNNLIQSRIFVSNYSSDTQVKAQADDFAGLLQAPGKTMEDTPQDFRPAPLRVL